MKLWEKKPIFRKSFSLNYYRFAVKMRINIFDYYKCHKKKQKIFGWFFFYNKSLL